MLDLSDYFCLYESMFVIPIEHLTAEGVSESFSTELRRRGLATVGWIERFDTAYRLYQRRANSLTQRAPGEAIWPRRQNCCIVTSAAGVRPYFQPFNQSSWLFYSDDFDPATSSLERSAYMFFLVERMGMVRDVTQSLVRSLAYFLTLSESECDDFCDGCRRSQRPDAAGFAALAEAMAWLRTLPHPTLNPSVVATANDHLAINGTGLALPRRLQPQFDILLRAWAAAARQAVEAFHLTYAHRGKERSGELCRWLAEAQPHLLLTSATGITWDFEHPQETTAVRRQIGRIGSAAAQSLRADWEVIDRHSRAFLAALAPGTVLPAAHADTAQNGLSYIHRKRQTIAYNLNEPGMERLKVPAPPYERLMLGARTIHEWGHLAADAGWIGVPAHLEDGFTSTTRELCDLMERVVRQLPQPFADLVSPELIRLRTAHGSAGWGLTQIVLARMADFQCNLLAQSFLTPDEIDTYVRNNVVSLLGASRPTALLQRLMRYSFEYQYLRFARLDNRYEYFLRSTWFAEEYLQTKVIDESDFAELLRLVEALCDAQRVDHKVITLPLHRPG